MDQFDASLIADRFNTASSQMSEMTAAVLSSAAASAASAPMDCGVPGMQFGSPIQQFGSPVQQPRSPRRVESKTHRHGGPGQSRDEDYESGDISDCASLTGGEEDDEQPAPRGPYVKVKVTMETEMGQTSMEVEQTSTSAPKKKKKRRRKAGSPGAASPRMESPTRMPPPPERPAVLLNHQEGRQQLLTDISDVL